MKRILIMHYPSGETPKVAKRLSKLFLEQKAQPKLCRIETKEGLEPREQARQKKSIGLKKTPSIKKYDLIVIGSPVFTFSPVPAVRALIRSFPKCNGKKFVLFSTSVGLPGTTIKRMQSLVSMKGGKVIASASFSSIFEFDEKKLKEVDEFFEILSKNQY